MHVLPGSAIDVSYPPGGDIHVTCFFLQHIIERRAAVTNSLQLLSGVFVDGFKVNVVLLHFLVQRGAIDAE